MRSMTQFRARIAFARVSSATGTDSDGVDEATRDASCDRRSIAAGTGVFFGCERVVREGKEARWI
jgi:hypothetical protein